MAVINEISLRLNEKSPRATPETMLEPIKAIADISEKAPVLDEALWLNFSK